MDEMIKVTWLGHSCFRIEYKGFAVICDPYEDGSVPGLGRIRENADMVFCSHEHHDHNFRDGVFLGLKKNCPFMITEIHSFHDDVHGDKRGENIIRIFEADGIKVAHFGDIGCQLSEEQTEQLKGIDCALLPVGGFFTVNAEQALKIADAVSAKVIIPMHYRSDDFGFDVIDKLYGFLDICGRWVNIGRSDIEIGHEEKRYTAVLTPAKLGK